MFPPLSCGLEWPKGAGRAGIHRCAGGTFGFNAVRLDCHVRLCASNRLLNRKQDVLIMTVTTTVNTQSQSSAFWVQVGLPAPGGWLLGKPAACMGGEGKGAERMLAGGSVSTAEQEESSAPFLPTFLVQIVQLRPSEQEYVFKY